MDCACGSTGIGASGTAGLERRHVSAPAAEALRPSRKTGHRGRIGLYESHRWLRRRRAPSPPQGRRGMKRPWRRSVPFRVRTPPAASCRATARRRRMAGGAARRNRSGNGEIASRRGRSPPVRARREQRRQSAGMAPASEGPRASPHDGESDTPGLETARRRFADGYGTGCASRRRRRCAQSFASRPISSAARATACCSSRAISLASTMDL